MSSEHDVRVIRVGPLKKHENADTLSVTEVDGRPVITRTEQWDSHLGRVICKLVGEGYHLRKGG